MRLLFTFLKMSTGQPHTQKKQVGKSLNEYEDGEEKMGW